MGNKHRPFYRIVVAKSEAGRDGGFIEVLGTYDPINKDPQTKKSTVKMEGDRALHWLMEGAQPTETVAYLLKREGVLEKYFESRPNAKRNFKFLDKRTASMSQKSVVEATAAPVAVAEPEPVVEAAPVASAEPEVVAAPEAVVEPEVVAEAAPEAAAEETPSEKPAE